MIADAPKLLDELCVRLGICLDPDDRARIATTRFKDLDSIELAVLQAEGLDPLHAPRRLRYDLRECISRYLA